MIERNTIFDYLAQIIITWGFTMLCLFLFCALFGESAYEYSSIFQLGNAGISISTAMQFLGMSALIVGLKWLFFSTVFIKQTSILLRSILMFFCIIATVGIFAAVFQWFPVNQLKPWIMFFICFFICASGSVTISMLKMKNDNQKLQSALEKLKSSVNETNSNNEMGTSPQ